MREPVALQQGRLTVAADFRVAQDNSAALDTLVRTWPESDTFGTIAAGYTYLGQFIAHELVSRPGNRMSERSPLFNLDSVYGPDPRATLHDPRYCDAQTGQFLLGLTHNDDGTGATRRDLHRIEKLAQIPEPRNDENLLIAQFHCLILRFHNCTLTRLARAGFSAAPDALFEAARLHVIATLHSIVEADYLKTVCDLAVYNSIFEQGNRYFRIAPDEALPPEFTAAVLRFGHSMVRSQYRVNYHPTKKNIRKLLLRQLFTMRGDQGLTDVVDTFVRSYPSVPESMAVDWLFFFKDPRQAFQKMAPPTIPPPNEYFTGQYVPDAAMRIEPGIVAGMLDLHVAPGESRHIALRNIAAGEAHKLPSGQEVARVVLQRLQLSEGDLGIRLDLDIGNSPVRLELLRNAGCYPQTPLWLYCLVEASGTRDGTLGPLGSLILCEVIRNAIENQREAFTSAQRDILERIQKPGICPPLSTMFDLINEAQGGSDAEAGNV